MTLDSTDAEFVNGTQTLLTNTTDWNTSSVGWGTDYVVPADLGPNGTNDLFNRLDTTLNAIASFRATLGSVQSRLNSTISNIDITNENLNAAMSRIRDVDYASETAKLTQNRILTAAGTSVLTQANQASESVLALLRGV